jgi:hypothetical protein
VLIVDTWPYSLNQHERFTNDEYEKAVMAVGPSPLDLDHLLEEVAKPLSYWNDGYEVAQTWQRYLPSHLEAASHHEATDRDRP